jgi:methylated-DNA-[protein]-cysteine S-methyltransferase
MDADRRPFHVETAVGPLAVSVDTHERVLAIRLDTPGERPPSMPFEELVASELMEYARGDRRTFSFAISPRGSPFDETVWEVLRTILYGETRSYGDVARAIGQPGASRAVGAANNRNPIPIVVPCHRVVGSDGSMVGFGGGLRLKRSLLAIEGVVEAELF